MNPTLQINTNLKSGFLREEHIFIMRKNEYVQVLMYNIYNRCVDAKR